MENDIENWIRHKLVGGKLMVKKGVFPHIFDCQQRIPTTESSALPSTLKREKDVLQNTKIHKVSCLELFA